MKQMILNHIQALASLSDRRVEWRMLLLLFVCTIAALHILFTGDPTMYGDLKGALESIEDETLRAQIASVMFPILAIADVLSELIWMAIVSYITIRVLRYLKKPLQFIHVFNVFLIIRLYEVIVFLALFLGARLMAEIRGTQPLFLRAEPGGFEVLLMFAISVGFLWLYIWSIKYLSNNRAGVTKHYTEKS
jgi:hypothetical protein